MDNTQLCVQLNPVLDMLSTMDNGVQVLKALMEGNGELDLPEVEGWFTLQYHLSNHSKETYTHLGDSKQLE